MATIEKRTGPKGPSYRVKVRRKHYAIAEQTFAKLADAKAWASRTESEMRDGTYAAGSGKTVAEAIDAFLAEELSNSAT